MAGDWQRILANPVSILRVGIVAPKTTNKRIGSGKEAVAKPRCFSGVCAAGNESLLETSVGAPFRRWRLAATISREIRFDAT